jgi:hypothetical protein
MLQWSVVHPVELSKSTKNPCDDALASDLFQLRSFLTLLAVLLLHVEGYGIADIQKMSSNEWGTTTS